MIELRFRENENDKKLTKTKSNKLSSSLSIQISLSRDSEAKVCRNFFDSLSSRRQWELCYNVNEMDYLSPSIQFGAGV